MTQATTQAPMGFGTAIVTVLRKYADFTGRATRAEFWWFILFEFLVSAALGAIEKPSLASLWSVVVLVPTLAVLVRRLRDAGHDWRNALWLLVPFAGIVVVGIYCYQPSKPEPDHATA